MCVCLSANLRTHNGDQKLDRLQDNLQWTGQKEFREMRAKPPEPSRHFNLFIERKHQACT